MVVPQSHLLWNMRKTEIQQYCISKGTYYMNKKDQYYCKLNQRSSQFYSAPRSVSARYNTTNCIITRPKSMS